MLGFKYSEFAHLIQTDPLYMAAIGGAIAVLSCGICLAVGSLVVMVLRRKK